jgi:hypothetical protein
VILAIRLESKESVLHQKGRKTFDFKLRSMRTGSDELLKKLAQEKIIKKGNNFNK